MQVTSSTLALSSEHAASETTRIQERFELRRSAPPRPVEVAAPEDDVDMTDKKTLLARLLYKQLTGREMGVARGRSHGSSQPARSGGGGGPAVSYTRREIHHEAESTSFAAAGSVTLASGEKIDFSLKLQMNRELTQVNSVSFNSGQTQDPIAVNLDGSGVRLNPTRQQFDLNGDGVDETIATLAEGSAWLTVDRNGNGAVDNGTELFGPNSGNGFSELAGLDEDHSGWIDEGDSAYSQLGLWNGDSVTSLKDAGIGALSISSVATPFSLKNGAELLGQVKASSVYLRENGVAGVLQQVDLSV